VTIAISNFPPALAGEDVNHSNRAAERLHEGVALLESRALFVAKCATCHGQRGRGTTVSSTDFSDPQALVDLTRDRIRNALVEDHGGLLGDDLGATERDAIIGYMRNYLMLPAPDADAEIGRAVYAKSCSVCHGDRGNAASWAKNSLNPAPADFTSHGLKELSRREMIAAVTFGKDNTAMMAFAVQLDRTEIAATVDYIRAAFMPEVGSGEHAGHGHGGRGNAEDDSGRHGDTAAIAGEHAGHPADEDVDAEDYAELETFPGGLAGDPVWGKSFYQTNCAECHGKDGDGKGRRAYFMTTKPKKFLSYAASVELGREELFKGISKGVIGTTMPAWEKVLDNQQIANVGEYVFRAFLHPKDYATDDAPAPTWRPADPVATGGSKKN